MAQIADNCKLLSGELRSWKKPKKVATPAKSGTIKAIFRMKSGSTDYWLHWLTEVDCVRGPIAGDTLQRVYYTGDAEPRMTHLTAAITGGTDYPHGFFVLGLPSPATAPTVTPSGGTGAAVSRAYCYRFRTALGENGPPSTVSAVVTGKVDDTWAITGMEAAPPNNGTITGATSSNGIVTVAVNTTAYLRAGEEVTHAGVVGMTDLNGKFTIASVVDATHYTVALSTAQAYTSGGTWARVAPHNTSGMTKQIFRTVTGTAGTNYQFVAEIPVGTTSYNDTKTDAQTGEVLDSTYWIQPPTNLHSIRVLPCGAAVGMSGNEVCFSEPYQLHAWPAKYRIALAFDGVGLGTFGQTVVACTKAFPYFITGTSPDAMSAEKSEKNEPCSSRRGIVDVGNGIVYPSPNGFVFAGTGGVMLASEQVLTKDEMSAYYPSTIHAAQYQGRYFGWYDDGFGGRGMIFSRDEIGLVPLTIVASASYLDPETNNLYLVVDGEIMQWDADELNNASFDWKSKAMAFADSCNMGAAQIDADFDAIASTPVAEAINQQVTADLAYNAAVLASGITRGELDGNMLDELMLDANLMVGGEGWMGGTGVSSPTVIDNRYLMFTLYKEGQQIFQKSVTSKKPFSMPSGYKSDVFEVRLSGNIDVHNVKVAETHQGLKEL